MPGNRFGNIDTADSHGRATKAEIDVLKIRLEDFIQASCGPECIGSDERCGKRDELDLARRVPERRVGAAMTAPQSRPRKRESIEGRIQLLRGPGAKDLAASRRVRGAERLEQTPQPVAVQTDVIVENRKGVAVREPGAGVYRSGEAPV